MSLLLRLLDDLHDAPPLGRRQRPGLHQQDTVADRSTVALVMRLELVRPTNDLAVPGVLVAVLDGHNDRIIHLVADNQPRADLAVPTNRAVGGGAGRCRRRCSCAHCLVLARGAHDSPPLSAGPGMMPCSRSLITV